jgi:hypothetical protein
MVKVRQKQCVLEAVPEAPIFVDGRSKVKEHGFAVLFAACVELQELLRAAEEDRDRLFDENSLLRTQVEQLQCRCGELSDRVRRLEDGESSAGLHENEKEKCRTHAAQQHGVWKKPQTHISRPSQVPPLHALLRGNFLVDSSSEGSKKHGALGESGVLQVRAFADMYLYLLSLPKDPGYFSAFESFSLASFCSPSPDQRQRLRTGACSIQD